MKKREKRIAKRMRMAEMYRAFFANPENMVKIRELELEWAIDLAPRMVRDEVLGRFARRA